MAGYHVSGAEELRFRLKSGEYFNEGLLEIYSDQGKINTWLEWAIKKDLWLYPI